MIICVLLLMMEANSFWGRRRRDGGPLPRPAALQTASSVAGQAGVPARINALLAVHRHERGSRHGTLPLVEDDLILCGKRELATKIPVKMVALLMLAAVAVDRDMAERAVAKVSACHSHKFFFVCQPTTCKK